jgi:ankyrin repeat domain-containing protein 50
VNLFLTNPLAFLDLLAYEEMDYREQEVQEAHINSCNWILDHQSYKEWVVKRSGLLGIRGKPGSGKSTLMKKLFRLLNEWKDSNCIQLSFFFHRRGTPLQQTQIGMFRSLLHQLLSQVPAAGQEFYSLCDKKKRWQGGSGKAWDWRVEELREVLSSALIAAVKDHAIRLFVDALDEAGDASQKVISYLYDMHEKLSKLEPRTAICFSCRHFPILAVNNGYEICLEDNNQEDIATYALAELRKQVLPDADFSGQGGILGVLQADVVNRASGVFMWVALVVPLVAKQYNSGKSLETIRQALQAVPSQLEEVYKHILTNVVDHDCRSQTLHLMQWIYLAEKPLSVMELCLAMVLDDSLINQGQYSCQESKDFVDSDARMKKRIVSLTGGLAEVKYHDQSNQGHQDTVQFIHQSVNDFLSKDKFKCLELDNTKDLIGQGHDRLSRSCINYLQLGEVRHRTNIQDDFLDSDAYYSSCYRKKVSRLMIDVPLIDYATKYWFVHAEKAESNGISQQYLLRCLKWPSNEFVINWTKVFRAIDRYNRRCPRGQVTLLHVAAASNLNTTMQTLLEEGANIESEDEDGNRPIHHAAHWGHESMIRMLLNGKAEVEVKNKDNETPLERAARAGHEVAVKIFLGGDGDDGDMRFRLNRALLAALAGRIVKLALLLLEQGADANAQGGRYGNALQTAAICGKEAVVGELLERGAAVNAQGGHFGNALQAQAFHGKEAVVRLLLKHGADINAQGGMYSNALQAAALNGNKAIVRLLIEHGADVNAQGGHFGNALQAAVLNCKEAVVPLLIEHGADVNAQGGYYGNALQAAANDGTEAVVRLLIEHGVDINAQGGHYGNALQAAARDGNEAVVRMLIEHGADVNAQGGRYGNALQAAANDGTKAVVQMLIEHGADVNAQGGHYGNALQAAACRGIEAVVRLLIEHGADINAQGGHYGNALQAAAFDGKEAIVRLLLEHSADVNAQGGYYGSALKAARRFRCEDIIQLLLEHGAKEDLLEDSASKWEEKSDGSELENEDAIGDIEVA